MLMLLLIVSFLYITANTAPASHTRSKLGKQYNLFNVEGSESPSIISSTTLQSGYKIQQNMSGGGARSDSLSVLAVAVVSPSLLHHQDVKNWFFNSVQNIPNFVKKTRSFRTQHLSSPLSCQIRVLGLGHYKALFQKKKSGSTDSSSSSSSSYEGGLATLRIKREDSTSALLPCYYVTGRNQHFVLVVILCDIFDDKTPGKADTRTQTDAEELCRSATGRVETATKFRLQLYPTKVQSFTAIHVHSFNPADVVYDDKSSNNSMARPIPPPFLIGLARTLRHIKRQGNLAGSSGSIATFEYQASVEQGRDRTVSPSSPEPRRCAAAVCTVQTFRNAVSGVYLHFFSAYYLRAGFLVIVYDRFGNHYEYIKNFLQPSHPLRGCFKYHAYSALQLALPAIYTRQYAASQSSQYVQYFARHVRDKARQSALSEAERMTQDQDKRRTYDLARLDYPLASGILFVDSDELLFCAEKDATSSMESQRRVQHDMIYSAISDGYDEIQVPRVSQFSRRPVSWPAESPFTSYDATETSIACMQRAYDRNNSLTDFFECWSKHQVVDKAVNPKSVDISSACPFHYNHYSCAIHKTYRREKYRCLCNIKKVELSECRIVHLTNKFLSDSLDKEEDFRSLLSPFDEMGKLWAT